MSPSASGAGNLRCSRPLGWGSVADGYIVAGNKVATRWVAEGTNSANFGNVPATGRRVRVDGLILDRVADGRVVERWEQWDQSGMMQQLGLA